jgi:predicted nucleic acid-binding protein
MIGVVDASALVRLFVPDGPLPEGFERFMRGVERGQDTAIAPELLMAEAANVLHKKRLAGDLTGSESDQLLAEFLAVPIRFFTHSPIIARAFELARDYRLTVYDTLYLALAEEHGAVLFTSDSRLKKAAADLYLG